MKMIKLNKQQFFIAKEDVYSKQICKMQCICVHGTEEGIGEKCCLAAD